MLRTPRAWAAAAVGMSLMVGAAAAGPPPRAPLTPQLESAAPVQLAADRRAMRRFCHDEAARRYRISPRRVRVSPPEPRGSGFRVVGSVPVRGGYATFSCKFGPRGGFDGMRETARHAGPPPPPPKPGLRPPKPGHPPPRAGLSPPEMREFCAREAARRYKVRRGRVDMARVRIAGESFTVRGRVRLAHRSEAFICRFGPRGGFDGMWQTS